MTELKIEVFTSNTCPHCPAAVRVTKELFENNPELKEIAKWKEMNTSTVVGSKKAKRYGIRSVPTIILTNGKTGEQAGLSGAPSEKRYLKVISEFTGKKIGINVGENNGTEEEKEKQNSFVDKFKKLWK